MLFAHALFFLSVGLSEPTSGGIQLNPNAKENKNKDMSALHTMSCANHAIQHRGALLQYLDMGFKSYPDIEDTRKALIEIAKRMTKKAGRELGTDQASWFSSYSSACPEPYWRDKSIGYVWVGAGIPTKIAEKLSPLLLFCPAASHQGSSEHSHTCAMRDLCVHTNLGMIRILKRMIKRAESGEVPYTSQAIKKMRHQLALREKQALLKSKNDDNSADSSRNRPGTNP